MDAYSAFLLTTDGFKKLTTEYTKPERHYHNMIHIDGLFNQLYVLKWNNCLSMYHDSSIKAAIAYHDFVYDPLSKTNEEDSAAVAYADITEYYNNITNEYDPDLNPDVVRDLILVTKHDPDLYPPKTIEERYMCDMDLAGLGADPAVFYYNSLNIRKEYHMIADDEFCTGRIMFFEKLLNREYIYYTHFIRERLEAQARENIQKEIARCQEKISS